MDLILYDESVYLVQIYIMKGNIHLQLKYRLIWSCNKLLSFCVFHVGYYDFPMCFTAFVKDLKNSEVIRIDCKDLHKYPPWKTKRFESISKYSLQGKFHATLINYTRSLFVHMYFICTQSVDIHLSPIFGPVCANLVRMLADMWKLILLPRTWKVLASCIFFDNNNFSLPNSPFRNLARKS